MIKSENNIDKACDYLLVDSSSTEPESPNLTKFDLLPDVLNAWNEEIDFDEMDLAFAEFEAENKSIMAEPIILKDQDLFTQLIDRFGVPHPSYRPGGAQDIATIPAELAKQIFDWWSITMVDNSDDPQNDLKIAQELADQEIAQQMQIDLETEDYKMKQRTKRLAARQRESDQLEDFPSLNPNGPIKYVSRSQNRGGQWINKQSLGHKDKIQKLKTLFPELPESRLVEYLATNKGDLSNTMALICQLTDKNVTELNSQRSKISRTKNTNTTSAVQPTADCLGDEIDDKITGSYDQLRSESFDLFYQGTSGFTYFVISKVMSCYFVYTVQF